MNKNHWRTIGIVRLQSREPRGVGIFVRTQKPDEPEPLRALMDQPDRERRGKIGREGQGMSVQSNMVGCEWLDKLELRPVILEANDRGSSPIKAPRCVTLPEVRFFFTADSNDGRADAGDSGPLFKVGSSDDDRIGWNNSVIGGIAIGTGDVERSLRGILHPVTAPEAAWSMDRVECVQ